MPHILKNNLLEVHVDEPLENYQFSRFDWTGKITQVKYGSIPFAISERTNDMDDYIFGKGFYNEFGIDAALGFEETKIGGWFHKIGVGLLKKDNEHYQFSKKYEIRPAAFEVTLDSNKVTMQCASEFVNGYSYVLKKTIQLLETGFSIHYFLENTGEKTIRTDEYTHNFTAINTAPMGPDYVLEFPFNLDMASFNEIVNPEGKLSIGQKQFSFNAAPNAEFFFSNLTGGQSRNAQWELISKTYGVGIRESADFKTDKINLWGSQHVISPELFHKISLKPDEVAAWQRVYEITQVA